MRMFTAGHVCSGHCHGKATAMDRWGCSGVIFFVGTPLDVLETHVRKMVCYERN